jgi:branched-chain amino acid transport system permease protein
VVAIIAVAAFVLGLPQFGTSADLFFFELVAIQVLFAISVNLLIGHAGVFSFGQAAFFGLGAYATGLLAPHDLAPPVSIAVAVVLSGLAGLVIGWVVTQAQGLAMAMLTLAIAQSFYSLAYHVQALGGENGLPGIRRLSFAGLNLADQTVFWFFCVVCVAIGVTVLRVIVGSPFGHALHSIRDDAKRATFLGLNVRAYRVAVFAVAGAGAGLAGSLNAYVNEFVAPEVLYWTHSGDPIIMSLIGGFHTFWGPAFGAVVYSWVTRQISLVTPAWMLYVGMVFYCFVLFLPHGIAGAPEAVRNQWKRWQNRR